MDLMPRKMHICIQKKSNISEKSKPLELGLKRIQMPCYNLWCKSLHTHWNHPWTKPKSRESSTPSNLPTSPWCLPQVVPLTPYSVPPASMYSAHEFTAQFTPHLFISLFSMCQTLRTQMWVWHGSCLLGHTVQFSRDWCCLPRDIWLCLETGFWLSHLGEGDWHPVGRGPDAAKHPSMHRTIPLQKKIIIIITKKEI